jgi:hypothetical protein
MEFKKVSINGVIYGAPVSGEVLLGQEGMCQSSIDSIQRQMKRFLQV